MSTFRAAIGVALLWAAYAVGVLAGSHTGPGYNWVSDVALGAVVMAVSVGAAWLSDRRGKP